MNVLETIQREKRLRGMSWEELADGLSITGEGLRVAFNRKSVAPYYIEFLLDKLMIDKKFKFDFPADEEIQQLPIEKPIRDIENAPNGKFERKKGKGLIPYYDSDFIGGDYIATFEAGSVKPAYYMDIPEFAGCDAFRIYNDSMENLIKSGTIVFGTKIENWREHLEYGQIYGIVCHDNRRFIKYIKKWNDAPNEYFYLVSENDFYDPWEIKKDTIKNVWLIHGWLNKRV